MKDIFKLVAGFKRFREKYYAGESSVYQRLAESGQSPKTLVIACSDSRVDPAILTSADPGELFVVRNVANLVPPFDKSKAGLHGVSSAIEFAVVNLKVENVIIMGHRQCGGIRALIQGQDEANSTFVGKWMSIARPARERVKAANPGADEDKLCRLCEMESIVVSIDNLKTFPFVTEAIAKRGLNIFGVYFDLEAGSLLEYSGSSFRYLVPDSETAR